MGEEGGYLMREHSLVAPYQGQCSDSYRASCTRFVHFNTPLMCVCVCVCWTGTGMDIPFWEFGGTSVVTSSHVRLTPDRQSKLGNLWNTAVSTHTIFVYQAPSPLATYCSECITE